MTSERDIERLLDRWFTERPTQVADRVIDDVAARIVRQPQRSAWRLQPWRFPTMSTPIKLVAVGAALLVVILGGAVFIGGGGEPVLPAPTATPSPSPLASASPSTAPTASAEFPAWFTPEADSGGAGILPAGSQTTRSFMPGSTFTVPEGWVNNLDLPIAYGLFPDTPANEAEYALSGEMAGGIFMVSVESPYFFCEAWEESRGTAAERVASLVASEAFVVSEPVDVTIGGLTGKQVDVQLDPGWTETCPGDPPTSDLSDVRNRVTYLDTPDRGVIAIAAGSRHAAGHEAFLAEAMPIVESFEFDLSN